MKLCVRCGKEKTESNFGKNASKKDGLTSYCKECLKDYYSGWNENNREARRNSSKKYRDGNKEKTFLATKKWRDENLSVVREIKKIWRAKNKEKVNAQKRESYQRHKDEILARQRQLAWHKTDKGKMSSKKWRQKNKDRVTVNNLNRKVALKNAKGKITPEQWEDVKKRYGYKCLRCGRNDVKLTIDHIIPIKLGGSNTVDNIQPLCGSCNSSKNIKIEDYRYVSNN